MRQSSTRIDRWLTRKQSMSPYHPLTLNVNQPPRSAWCAIPMNGEVVVVVVGHCGRGPSSYSLYRYYHQEALRYYNIGTFVHQNYYLFIFLSKVSSSPVIQMKQSWHSECDMSRDSVVLRWIILHRTGDYNNFLNRL